eukprot:TRINITY_DN810_c0_g5_i1.p2 TRINITY_DN810_c0_g5~~TRINITY_DN810_c0_g5_i1.p2  ORF type:complete len:107 (-),score=9.95 TRINITY_DN810_c0_g5_i1:766-1086(-)
MNHRPMGHGCPSWIVSLCSCCFDASEDPTHVGLLDHERNPADPAGETVVQELCCCCCCCSGWMRAENHSPSDRRSKVDKDIDRMVQSFDHDSDYSNDGGSHSDSCD